MLCSNSRFLVQSKRKTRRFFLLKMEMGQQRRRSRDAAAAASSIVLALLMLSGCVSAKPEGKDVAAVLNPAALADREGADGAKTQAAAPNGVQPAQPGYVDPRMVSAANGKSAANTMPSGAPQAPQVLTAGNGADQPNGGYAMQATGVAAGSHSIFSSGTTSTGQADMDSVPAYAPTRRIVPALKSVYSTQGHAPAEPTPQPSQDQSSNAVPGASSPAPTTALASGKASTNEEPSQGPQNIPMAAALFAGVPKKRGATGQDAATALGGMAQPGVASLGKAAQSFDESHLDYEDDKPTGLMKLVSMPGLTRIAPNGLVLQTNQVNVGCLKPELVHRIKELESHYRKPAIITSGYRPPKGVTHGSKHFTCEAVDIQIKGVSKWDLADYLRSLPGRGGVGTYCHTESVHMDIGESRDWNWPCRKTGTSS